MKSITVFDGLQLFLDSIEGRTSAEKEKINSFLIKYVNELSNFPTLFNYIHSKQYKDSATNKVVEETKEKKKIFTEDADEIDQPKIDELVENKELEPILSKDSLSLDGLLEKSSPETNSNTGMKARSVTNISSDAKKDEKQKSKPLPAPASVPGGPLSSTVIKEEHIEKEQKPMENFNEAPLPPAPPSPPPPSVEYKEARRKEERSKKSDKGSKNKKSSRPKTSMMVADEEKMDIEMIETGKRGVLVDFYSRMNINQVYDFTVKIDKELQQAKKKQSDLLTGEQREQVADEITVVEDLPIEIELSIPGCLVSPSVHYVSPKAQTSQVTFYVTPYVKFSKRMGSVVIGQTKLDKKVIDFHINVIDRRIMKIFSLIGILIASIPSIWPYLFNVEMNTLLLNSARVYIPLLTTDYIVGIEVALGGLITIVSLLAFRLYSSKRSSLFSNQLI